jgi:hypothetical protein
MPVPDKHLERLKEDLEGRERWLGTLRLHLAALQDEANAHEIILALGRDPNLRRVLGELYDRPDLDDRIAEDPRSFFEEKGVDIPEGVTLTSNSARSSLEASFQTTTVEFGVGWSRQDGFYLVTSPGKIDATSDGPSTHER